MIADLGRGNQTVRDQNPSKILLAIVCAQPQKGVSPESLIGRGVTMDTIPAASSGLGGRHVAVMVRGSRVPFLDWEDRSRFWRFWHWDGMSEWWHNSALVLLLAGSMMGREVSRAG
jgi:hypothetical protein